MYKKIETNVGQNQIQITHFYSLIFCHLFYSHAIKHTHTHSHFIHPNHVRFSILMLRIRFELFFYLHGNDFELMQWRRFTFRCWLNSIELNREIWIDSPVSRRRYTHKLLVIWPFMPWLHISPCRLICSMLCYVILLDSHTHTCFGL